MKMYCSAWGRLTHTAAAQLFALSNDQPNRDTNEQIDLSSPSGQTSTLHPSAAHNSFLKRIAGKNHSINSRLRDGEPRLTTNETGLSLSQTKQVVEARGVKSAPKEKQRIKGKPAVRWNHRPVVMETRVYLRSCQKYHVWPPRPLAGGCQYWNAGFFPLLAPL